MKIPDTVRGEHPRDLYVRINALRAQMKDTAATCEFLRKDAAPEPAQSHLTSAISSEVTANVTLAYRHLEDASMRLGKALQALDGGVSVYDKATTVGA